MLIPDKWPSLFYIAVLGPKILLKEKQYVGTLYFCYTHFYWAKIHIY